MIFYNWETNYSYLVNPLLYLIKDDFYQDGNFVTEAVFYLNTYQTWILSWKLFQRTPDFLTLGHQEIQMNLSLSPW